MKKILYIICGILFTCSINATAKVAMEIPIAKSEKGKMNPPTIRLLSARKIAKENMAGFIIVSGDTDFGDVALGQMVELTFTIENDPLAPDDLSVFSIDLLNGNADFSISDNPIGGGTTGFGFDLAPGETIKFSVTFAPGAVGLSEEVIDIQSSDDLFPDGFTLDISGAGLDPCEDVFFNINVFSSFCPGEALDMEETEADADFYEWTGPNGFISNDRNPSIPNATTANNGTYTLYLEKGACQLEENFDVEIIFSTAPTINLTGNSTVCAGEALTISANASNVASYQWIGPNNFSSTSANVSISNATSANSGIYTLEVTSGDGCGEFGEFEVEVFEVEPITIEPEAPPCVGGEINLATSETIENITSLSWSGPNGFSSSVTFPTIPNATSANSGTYTVNVTYETGCTTSASRNITIGESPTIDISSNDPACVGETLNLTHDGDAGTYQWTGPNNFSTSNRAFSLPNLTTVNSGNYNFELTGANGCTATETINITLSTLPVLSLSNSGPFCAGEAQLTVEAAASDAINYRWTQPNTNTIFEGATITIDNPTETNTGNYTVTAANEAGCTATESITVGYNGANPALNIEGDESVCVEGTLSLTETGGEGMNHQWTPPGSSSFPIDGASLELNNITSEDAGTYTVIADNGNGCSSTASVTVAVNVLPNVVAAVSTSEVCEGETINLQETGRDLITWNWEGPNNFTSTVQNPSLPNVALNASGTYTVTGMDENGCSAENSVSVTVEPVFNAGTGSNQQVCAGTTIDLSTLLTDADAGGVFTDVNNAGTLNNGILETTNLTAGTYRFIYSQVGDSDCIGQTSIVIAVQAVFNAGADVIISECQGGTIDLSSQLSGADEGGTFIDINNSGGLNGNTFNTTNLTAGTYNLRYQVGGGLCPQDEATLTVNIIAVPDDPQLSDVTYCGGGTLQLVASEGDSYSWSTGASTQQIGVRPTTATTYSVTVTNGELCSVTSSALISVGTITDLAIAGETTICKGDTTQLTVSGATTYEWMAAPGLTDLTSAAPQFNPEVNTTYGVVAQNEIGCTAFEEVTIIVNDLPTIEPSADATFCLGTGATISATGTNSYTWSPALGLDNATSAAPFANPTETTIYTVKGTDENGCSSSASINVAILALPPVSLGEDRAICEGEPLTLTATGGTSYTWTAADGLTDLTATDQTVSPTILTTYQVTGTNENGCANSAEVMIGVSTNPIADAGVDQTICSGTTAELTASGGASYEWSNQINEAINTVMPTTATTYLVTVTSSEGCTSTDEVRVNVNELPTIQTSPDAAFCVGTGMAIAANGAINYTWSPSVGLDNSTSNNPFANPATTTTYTVQGTDENGCIGTGEVQVEIYDLPTITLGENQAICEGEEVTLTPTGGTSYQWTAAAGITDLNANTQTLNPAVLTNYEVIGTDENGCQNTSTVSVMVNANPVADAGLDQSTCNGVGVELIASGGGTYEWSNSVNNANNPVSPEATTTYTVKVSNAEGCTDEDEVTVTIAEDFAVMVSPDTFFCLGGTAQLAASGGVDYTWSPAFGLDNASTANPVANPLETTNYEVTIKDEMGCTVKKTVAIEVKQVENFSITEAQDVCAGNAVTVAASGGTTYNWGPSEIFTNPTLANQELTLQNSNTLTVEVTDEFGCLMTDSVRVTIRPNPQVTAMAASNICEGEDLSLTGNGAGITEWNWSGSNYTSAEQNPILTNISDNQSGAYMLIGKTEFGCEASATVEVIVNPIPTISIEAAEMLCENDALVLKETGGNNITNWEWTNDQGGSFSGAEWDLGAAQVAFTATYALKVTDTNGCSTTTQKSITVNAAPKAGADQTLAFCQGESIDLTTQLSNNDPNGIFESNLGANQLEGTLLNTANISEGDYTVTYKVEQAGCPTDEAVLSIQIDEQKMAGLDNSEMVCQGTAIDLFSLLQQASEGGIFQETTSSGALSGQVFNTAQVLPGKYELSYTVGNSNTCGEDQASFVIEVAEQVKAGADVQTDICQVGTIDLVTLLDDPTTGGQFTDISASNSLSGSALTAENLPLGTYLFDYQVTSANQCPSDTARLTINVKEMLTAGMDSDTSFCTGDPIDLTALLVNADAGGTFNPMGNSLPDFSGTTLPTTGLTAETINFEYTVGGIIGCPEDKAIIAVSLNESPDLNILATDTFFCIGETVKLTAMPIGGTGGFSLEWATPAGTTLTETEIEVNEAGNYQLRVKDNADCTASSMVTLKSNTDIGLGIDGKTNLCEDEDLTLMSTITNTDFSYNWQLPNGNNQPESMLVLANNAVQAGVYTLQVMDELGCLFEEKDTVEVADGASFKSNFLTGQTACAGDTLHFIEISETNANSGVSYKWDFGDGGQSTERDPVYTYAQSGKFAVKLEVTNQACENISLAKEVNIVACRNSLFDDFNVYPNPSDGAFTIELSLFQTDNVLIEIFNHFGQKVSTRLKREVHFLREDFNLSEKGFYFITIRTLEGQISATRKVLVEER